MPVEVTIKNQNKVSTCLLPCPLLLSPLSSMAPRWGGKNGPPAHLYCLVSLGDDGIDNRKKAAAGRKPAAGTMSTEVRERFRIYFPTDGTVASSRGGRNVSFFCCNPVSGPRVITGLFLIIGQHMHERTGRRHDLRAGQVVAVAYVSPGPGAGRHHSGRAAHAQQDAVCASGRGCSSTGLGLCRQCQSLRERLVRFYVFPFVCSSPSLPHPIFFGRGEAISTF